MPVQYCDDIRRRRKQARLAQIEVARAVDIHLPTLVDLENGRIVPDEPTYDSIVSTIERLVTEKKLGKAA